MAEEERKYELKQIQSIEELGDGYEKICEYL